MSAFCLRTRVLGMQVLADVAAGGADAGGAGGLVVDGAVGVGAEVAVAVNAPGAEGQRWRHFPGSRGGIVPLPYPPEEAEQGRQSRADQDSIPVKHGIVRLRPAIGPGRRLAVKSTAEHGSRTTGQDYTGLAHPSSHC